LYLYHFLKNPSPVLYPNAPEKHNDSFNLNQISNNMREILRLKHYSYKTERSYIGWVKRFYYYINEVKKGNIQAEKLSSDDVRNYLSYLAIKKKVSASTQNQAFNSLLFLFRDILNIELKEIDKTVRAKRGVKLPVVLSPEEVQKLFKYARGLVLLHIFL
jgi:site-specific recombinase XerD